MNGACDKVNRDYEPAEYKGDLRYQPKSVEYYPPGSSQKEWSCVASVPPSLTNYYSMGGIEVINYIKAKLTPEQYKGYLLGNIYKYSGRMQYKGEEVKDMKKLQEYTTWLKETYGNHN